MQPKIPIQPKASEVTGLRYNPAKKEMFFKNDPVQSVPIKLAIKNFLDFIGDSPVLLAGHNIKVFDCHVFFNTLQNCHMLADIQRKVSGYLDTLPLFKSSHPGLHSYKQESLYTHFTQKSYDAHNALCDVAALKEILSKASIHQNILKKHTFTGEYISAVKNYQEVKARNLKSWQPLMTQSFISKGLAAKAAGSGLTFEHVCVAYKRPAWH